MMGRDEDSPTLQELEFRQQFLESIHNIVESPENLRQAAVSREAIKLVVDGKDYNHKAGGVGTRPQFDGSDQDKYRLASLVAPHSDIADADGLKNTVVHVDETRVDETFDELGLSRDQFSLRDAYVISAVDFESDYVVLGKVSQLFTLKAMETDADAEAVMSEKGQVEQLARSIKSQVISSLAKSVKQWSESSFAGPQATKELQQEVNNQLIMASLQVFFAKTGMKGTLVDNIKNSLKGYEPGQGDLLAYLKSVVKTHQGGTLAKLGRFAQSKVAKTFSKLFDSKKGIKSASDLVAGLKKIEARVVPNASKDAVDEKKPTRSRSAPK